MSDSWTPGSACISTCRCGVRLIAGSWHRVARGLSPRMEGFAFDANIIVYVENSHPMALEPGPHPPPRGDEAEWAPRGARPTEVV